MSLFIGGLPWDCSEEDIRQAFAKVGLTMVSARIPRNEASGKARGHSFVEMASQEEAQRAVTPFFPTAALDRICSLNINFYLMVSDSSVGDAVAALFPPPSRSSPPAKNRGQLLACII